VEDLAEARIKAEAALAAVEAKRVTTERKAAERAAHSVAEMDKVLAYWRDVDRRKACRCAQSEHRLERHRTVHCQDAAIRAASNGNGAALL
jgi:hypothetical protein